MIDNLKIRDIESIAIVTKKYDSPNGKARVNIGTGSYKTRQLNYIAGEKTKNIFRFLKEENALSDRYFSEKNYMDIFALPQGLLKGNSNEDLILSYTTIKSETRKSIFAPAPTKIRYNLTIPPKSYLDFGYAIAPAGWEDSDGISFYVLFKPVNSENKQLFYHFVNPGDPKNRKWFKQRIDLSALSGLSGELIFETRPYDSKVPSNAAEGDKYFDFGLWGAPGIYFQREPDQLNLILISLDTLQADHIGAYGYFRNTTPNIDRLAKNGTFFLNTITQAPWTMPSHMAMLTSLYPSQLGYSLMNKINNRVSIPGEVDTLAEVLKKKDYLTAGFTGGANVSKVFGFNHGFDFYNERWGKDIDVQYKNMGDWIEKHQKDKFFLFFHTYEIHEYPAGKHEIFTDGINPLDEINYKKALYDGKIKFTDDYIGLLIKKLRSLKILDKTLIIITSDHGEEFFEHGLGGHGDQLYDEVLRVPLIFHLNGIVPPNKAIGSQVREIDIMPTILDILDIAPPDFIEGISLAPLFNKDESSDLVAFTEGAKHDSKLKAVEPRSIRTSEYKFIYYPKLEQNVLDYLKSLEGETGNSVEMYNKGEGELYNLSKDPMEKNNIINLKSSIAADLKKEVQAFIKKSLSKGGTNSKVREAVKIDKATLDRLKSLGYIQ